MRKIGKQIFIWGMVSCLVIGSSLQVYAEEYEYDELNRVIKVLYEDGNYAEYEYDSNGNILSINIYHAPEEEIPDDDQEETTDESQESGEESDKDLDSEGELKEDQEDTEESVEESKEPGGGEASEEDKDSSNEAEESKDDIPKEGILQRIWNAIKSFFSKLVQWIG